MPLDLRMVKAILLHKNKRGRLKRPPALLYPLSQERSYQAMLLDFVEDLEKGFEQDIGRFLQLFIDEQRRNLPRTDEWTDNVENLVNNLSLKFDDRAKKRIEAMTLNLGKSTSKFNLEQWRKATNSVFGIDLLQYEPWLDNALKSFVKENVSLIKSIKDKSLSTLETSLQRDIRKGTRVEDIRKNIQEVFDVTKSRAKLIARDQIGKLNGELTQLRQQEAGIKSYIWRTALDERVREEHAEREGEKFYWSDPPEGGHPGEDYQCRCYAEPNFEEVDIPKELIPVVEKTEKIKEIKEIKEIEKKEKEVKEPLISERVEFVDKITGKEYETLGIFDAEGNLLKEITDKKADYVNIYKKDTEIMKGNIMIHNHPGGKANNDSSFSWPDIDTAFKVGLSQSEVVTNVNKFHYVMNDFKMPAGAEIEHYKYHYDRIRKETIDILQKKITKGEISIGEANSLLDDRIIFQFARETKLFNYTNKGSFKK